MITPRYYQAEGVQSIFDYFDNGKKGNPLLLMPTASGKTIVIASFIYQVLQRWPSQRFIIATHVKELIQQNASKFGEIWPHAPFGVHSQGLGSRDIMQPIIFGGVQSMVAHVEALGHRDIMFIDEAHLVSPNDGTRYQKFINGLKVRNPRLKVIGLSATGYRQGMGRITDDVEGRVFTDVCYDLTTMAGINRLIYEGYLSPLIPKRTSIEIDTSELTLGANGDYNQKQLAAAANREKVTYAALKETIQFGHNRRSWLIFSSGIEHAENINNMLNSFGISSVCVHSKLAGGDKERDAKIAAHKRGDVRCMVGNNIFTTGYDHPPLDLIVDMQPTMSTAKHVQKYGRGMRIYPDKENCLVLDFAGNTRRLGPINDPVIPRAKGPGTGEAPVKICEVCGVYNHPTARECIGCGEPFEFQTKIVKEASVIEVIKSEVPIIEWIDVTSVYYYKHISRKTELPLLRVNYFCGLNAYEEWISFNNPKARWKAKQFWQQRHKSECPHDIDEAMKVIGELRPVRRVKVWLNRARPEILGVEF